MYDELDNGIDELLLARLKLVKIEIPCSSEKELLQLRQKIYMRGKKIREECEASGNLTELYRAASTFTVTPYKEDLILLLQDRSNIVGVSAIQSVLSKIALNKDDESLANLISSEKKTANMLDELEAMKEVNAPNPFYTREND